MKNSFAFKSVLFLIVSIFALAAIVSCTGNSSVVVPEIDGEEKTWNRITVFVPLGMDLIGSPVDSTDKDIVYVQNSKEIQKYFRISLCTEQSAEEDVQSSKNAFGGEDVNFKIGSTEWKGVKYKYGADCFIVYAKINGQTVLVNSSRFAQDSAEAKAVLGSIKISD